MFQDNFSRLRREKGFTQEILAIKLQVTRQTVSKWEKGLSVPDADMLIKIAEVFDVDVSLLLGTEIPKADDAKNEIAIQLARIAEQLSINSRRKKRFWNLLAGLFLLAGLSIGVYKILPRNTYTYGYIGSTFLIKDASIIKDADTLEWISRCDYQQEKEIYILFSECAPAENHEEEGYVSKVLIYVPQGFSDIRYTFQDDTGFYRRGKKMILQISKPYVEKETYQLALIETPQQNISAITVKNFSGEALATDITKTAGSFSVYRTGE